MLILLILLIFFFGFGGNVYNGGVYRGYGFGLGGVVLLILLVLLLTGGLGSPRLGW